MIVNIVIYSIVIFLFFTFSLVVERPVPGVLSRKIATSIMPVVPEGEKKDLSDEDCRIYAQSIRATTGNSRLSYSQNMTCIGRFSDLAQLDDAYICLKDVLARHPTQWKPRMEYVKLLIRMAKYEDSLKFIDSLKEIAPPVIIPNLHHFHAETLLRMGRIEDAIPLFEQALKGDVSEAAGTLSLYHLNNRDFERAYNLFFQIGDKGERDEISISIFDWFLDHENVAAAEPFLRLAIKNFPGWAKPFCYLGKLLIETDKGRGTELLLEGMRLDPDEQDCPDILSVWLRSVYGQNEATRLYLEYTKDLPKSAIIQNNYSRLLQLDGRYEEAMAILLEQLKLNPDFGESYWRIAELLQTLNRLDEARPYLEKAIVLEPTHHHPYGLLARYHQLKGDFKSLIALFTRAMEAMPYDGWPYVELGIVYRNAGTLDLAETYLKKAMATAKNPMIEILIHRPIEMWFYKAVHELGEIYRVQGRMEEFEELYR